MTLLPVFVAFVITQAPAAPAQSSTPAVDAPKEAAPDAAPWKGTFDEGFTALRMHTEKREFDEAISIADGLLAPHSILRWKLELASHGGWRETLTNAIDPLLDFAGWNGLAAPVRAEIWYAKGVIQTAAKNADATEQAFEKARELAGPGELRNDSIYDLGCLALSLGEEQRAKIPEISGKPAQPTPPTPPTAAPGSAAPAQEPDPLELARAAYLHARERFIERLKSDWNDADTRANLELVMKRLKELDEIEKKREEQKKQDEKKDQQDKDKQKQDPKDKQDKDKQDKPKDDKDKDQKKPDDKKDPDKKPGEDKKDEQKPPDQPKPDDKKDDAKKTEPPKTDPKEQQMSKEEMMQILEKLAQLEEQAKKLQEQLKQTRKVRVKKDW